MIRLYTLIVIVLFFQISQLKIKAQCLKKTAKKYTITFSQTNFSQTEFFQRVKPFIDPNENVDSLCLDYFNHWKQNLEIQSFPIKTKIERVEKYDKDRAKVYISNIWNWPTGEKYYFLSETIWIRIEGKWYRTGEPSKIIEKRKI